MKHLIQGITRSEVDEVGRYSHAKRRACRHSAHDTVLEVDSRSTHVSYFCQKLVYIILTNMHAPKARIGALLTKQHYFTTPACSGSCAENTKNPSCQESLTLLSRSAFITTVNEDSAIAAPANIGDINIPNTG